MIQVLKHGATETEKAEADRKVRQTVDAVFADVWRAGVVLAGVSAGSVCWHVGGTTDSFGPDLRAEPGGADGVGHLE